MTWTVFVEGGGKSKDLRTRCREGFAQFLGRLNLEGGRPKIVACGTRADAFKRLCIALDGDATESYLLLVDSEAVVSAGVPVWKHVCEREGDNWPRPVNARDEHLHFMAVCMESWLVADVESLGKFYGKNFRSNPLPQTAALESVDKDTIMSALRSATRDTAKGEYSKGKISFAALGAIKASVVSKRMSFCGRFAKELERAAKL